MNRKAEHANYWDTTVQPASSQADIISLLTNFGADSIMLAQGNAGGKYAWIVRFEWNKKTYRFVFIPLECEWPNTSHNFGGKRRTHTEQAKFQMGRIAVHFIKAILTAAETQPGALFGFLELPGIASNGNIPPVASEVDVDELSGNPPLLQIPVNIEEIK